MHADVGEVGVEPEESFDHEGVVVGAGDALELVGLSGGELGVTIDHGEVVADRGGVLRGGVGVQDALPALLEGLGGDGGAVVELGALHEVEGELVGGVVDVPGLGGEAHELVLGEVIGGEGVKELVAHHHTLILLEVIRVDGARVVDVVFQGATLGGGAGSGAGVSTLLAAGGERGHGAGGQATLHERATVHRRLGHNASLCCDALSGDPCAWAPEHLECGRGGPGRLGVYAAARRARRLTELGKSPRLQTWHVIIRYWQVGGNLNGHFSAVKEAI